MKWPWSKEKTFTSVDGSVTLSEAEFLRSCLKDERERYAALLEKYHALRVAGAVPEAKPEPQRVAIVTAADELRDLIHERSSNDLRKRGMMLAQLRRDRAAGVDEDKIRDRIETGVSSDGVPA